MDGSESVRESEREFISFTPILRSKYFMIGGLNFVCGSFNIIAPVSMRKSGAVVVGSRCQQTGHHLTVTSLTCHMETGSVRGRERGRVGLKKPSKLSIHTSYQSK